MKTKEETIIEIEKTLKEKGVFSKELSEDELAKVSGGSGFENTGYAQGQRYAFTEIYYFDNNTMIVQVTFRVINVSYSTVYVGFIYNIDKNGEKSVQEGKYDQYETYELDAMLASGEIERIL